MRDGNASRVWTFEYAHLVNSNYTLPKKLNKALKKTCNQEPIKSNLDPSTKKRRKNTTTQKKKGNCKILNKFEHSTPEKKEINNQEPIQSELRSHRETDEQEEPIEDKKRKMKPQCAENPDHEYTQNH